MEQGRRLVDAGLEGAFRVARDHDQGLLLFKAEELQDEVGRECLQRRVVDAHQIDQFALALGEAVPGGRHDLHQLLEGGLVHVGHGLLHEVEHGAGIVRCAGLGVVDEELGQLVELGVGDLTEFVELRLQGREAHAVRVLLGLDQKAVTLLRIIRADDGGAEDDQGQETDGENAADDGDGDGEW